MTVAEHTNSHRHGTWSGLGAILLWGTTFALARSLSESLGPLTSAAAVYTVAVLFLLPGRLRKPPQSSPGDPLPAAYLAGCGALFVAYTALLYLAVGHAANRQQLLEVALINYLWPTLTVLLSVFVLQLRFSIWLLPAAFITLTGLFLVVTQGSTFSISTFRHNLSSSPLPYGLAGIAAFSWAAYSVLTRKWVPNAKSGAVGIFLLSTAAVLWPLAWASQEVAQWTPRVTLELLAQGASTAAAYALWDKAMRLGNLTLVTTASYLTPLLSTTITCAYLHVTPSRRLLYGAALLVAGSLISYWSVRTPRSGLKPDNGPELPES